MNQKEKLKKTLFLKKRGRNKYKISEDRDG